MGRDVDPPSDRVNTATARSRRGRRIAVRKAAASSGRTPGVAVRVLPCPSPR